LFATDIVLQQMEIPKPLNLRIIQESNTVHVNINGTFNPTSTRLFHPFPVIKGFRYQRISRNGGNGFVPVLYFDRIKADIDHIPVCIVFGHGDPVAHIDHLVGRKLDTGYKSQYGVFKYQHQDRSHGSQAGHQGGGCFVAHD